MTLHPQLDQLQEIIAALRARPEKRAVYRVKPEAADRVRCCLHVGPATSVVTVVDISSQGAHLFLTRDACAALKAGAGPQPPLIILSLDAQGMRRPMRLTANVRQYRPVDGGVHARVQFPEAVGARQDVEVRLRALFNARSALRVKAPMDPPIDTRLVVDGVSRPLLGALVDASLVGVRLALPPGGGAVPAVGTPIRLQWRLPDTPAPSTLAGHVARWEQVSVPGGAADIAGIRFDEEAGDGTRGSRELARFVVARQLKDREAAAKAASAAR